MLIRRHQAPLLSNYNNNNRILKANISSYSTVRKLFTAWIQVINSTKVFSLKTRSTESIQAFHTGVIDEVAPFCRPHLLTQPILNPSSVLPSGFLWIPDRSQYGSCRGPSIFLFECQLRFSERSDVLLWS